MVAEIAALLVVYPLWALIHEGVHAIVAKHFGATVISFRPWPNWSLGRFAWGSVQWVRPPDFPDHLSGRISFAPRLPAFLATLVCPALAFYGAPLWVSILVGGGLLDQLVNSTGVSSRSDLRKWSSLWDHNPWFWRVAGLGSALMSAAVTLELILR